MSIWEYLFDSDYTQRNDIGALQGQVQSSGAWLAELQRQLHKTQQRADRLELVLEALVQLLETRGSLGREELEIMVQRVDLADGVEDGRIGPDKSATATKCPLCGRPLNPERGACIYCGQNVTAADLELMGETAPQVRYTRCVRCYRRVPQQESYFSPEGMVCGACREPDGG